MDGVFEQSLKNSWKKLRVKYMKLCGGFLYYFCNGAGNGLLNLHNHED